MLIDFKITVIIKSEIVVFLDPVEELLAVQVLPFGLGSEGDGSGVQRFELDYFLFLLFGARVFDYRFFSNNRSSILSAFNRTFSRFFIFFLDFLYDFVDLRLDGVKTGNYLLERLFDVGLVVFGVFDYFVGLFDDFFLDFFFKLFFDFFVHSVLLFCLVFRHCVQDWKYGPFECRHVCKSYRPH